MAQPYHTQTGNRSLSSRQRTSFGHIEKHHRWQRHSWKRVKKLTNSILAQAKIHAVFVPPYLCRDRFLTCPRMRSGSKPEPVLLNSTFNVAQNPCHCDVMEHTRSNLRVGMVASAAWWSCTFISLHCRSRENGNPSNWIASKVTPQEHNRERSSPKHFILKLKSNYCQ